MNYRDGKRKDRTGWPALFFRAIAPVLAVIIPTLPLLGATYYWDAGGGTDRDWSNALNWSADIEPTAADSAILGHTGYSNPAVGEITQSNEVCTNLRLGNVAGFTGILTVAGGTLAGSGTAYIGNAGGHGLLTLSAGSMSFNSLLLGTGAGSSLGIVTQSGGRATFGTATLGDASGNEGRYVLSDGLFTNSGSVTIGNNGYAQFVQTGGTNFVGDSSGNDTLTLGSGLTGAGLYRIEEGALLAVTNGSLNSGMRVGGSGDGRLLISGGTVEVAARITVRANEFATGVVRGWGSVQGGATLVMHGMVIADGLGIDRILAFICSGSQIKPATSVTNYPTGTNGWYAVNRGLLQLTPIRINKSGTVFWGETTDGGVDFDLVNAASITIAGYTTLGGSQTNLTGKLYATDRSDLPARTLSSKIIGLWRFETVGFSFSSLSITCRYDHVAANSQGIAENDLKLYLHNGTEEGLWAELTTAVDSTNRWISTSGITNTTFFLAAGLDVSTPTTGPRGTVISVR